MEQVTKMEGQFFDLIMTQEHLFLLIGIFSIILSLKKIKPVSDFLFSDKWVFLVAPINVALSAFGVFVLQLTTLTTTGMKIVICLAASTLVTFTYESVAKHAIPWLVKALKKFIGNGNGKAPTK